MFSDSIVPRFLFLRLHCSQIPFLRFYRVNTTIRLCKYQINETAKNTDGIREKSPPDPLARGRVSVLTYVLPATFAAPPTRAERAPADRHSDATLHSPTPT